jgi:predicted extracellular nuclease
MAEGKVPKQGDKVTLVGEYVEFVAMGAMSPDTLSEINLGNPADLTITGSATAPTPPVVAAADLATGGAKAENYEGVPVTVENVAVTNPDLGFGEYEVTGGLRVDDYFIYYASKPAAGTQGLTLTGVMMYGFDNFKLAPRTCDDVVGYDCSGDPPETTTSTTGPMGDVTIFDIQKGSVSPMTVVTVENVIVTSGLTFKGDGFFVQDPMGGEYSGIYVYVGMNPDGLAPKPGDVVTINGLYTEYFEMSQISASQAGDVTVTGTDTVPAPAVVPAADIATGGAKAENWEGVLVRVEGVTVATEADNFGEWTVDSMLHVDDLFFAIADWPKPAVGEMFASITGPLMYSFDNFKIAPRDPADLAK